MTAVISCDRDGDQYPEFSASIQDRFDAIVGSGRPLFTTDAQNLFDSLFDSFLSNLPAEARQHYTCNACRHFVTRYGGLVAISESGEAIPVLWDKTGTPDFFRKAVTEMQKAVLKAKVTGVFISDQNILGQPVTGEWHHMAIVLPLGMVRRDRLKNAWQEIAQKLEEYRMLCSALQDYPPAFVGQALNLIASGSLYRDDKVTGVAEWFKALQDRCGTVKDSKRKANIRWLAVATAPIGFAHLRGGMFGTLLNDLKEGKSVPEIVRSFKAKMDPLQYMRPQVAPARGNIEQAEKIVEKLGIAASLRRRYARFDEIPHFLWLPHNGDSAGSDRGGVFGHLVPKDAPAHGVQSMTLPSAVMTWEKFQKTVLPTAESIDAKVAHPAGFMAIITAADPATPNILRWGNAFSWYFRRYASHADWNMVHGRFETVRGITETPNLWGEEKVAHAGHQVFFLLDGCRDVTGGCGGGFFPEMLKSELHEVRSTLEAYANKAIIEDAEAATACGAGFSKDNTWDLTLKVTANNSTRLITIDRWD